MERPGVIQFSRPIRKTLQIELSQSVLNDNHTVTLANGQKSVNGPDYLGVGRASQRGKYYANALRTDAVRLLREVLISIFVLCVLPVESNWTSFEKLPR